MTGVRLWRRGSPAGKPRAAAAVGRSEPASQWEAGPLWNGNPSGTFVLTPRCAPRARSAYCCRALSLPSGMAGGMADGRWRRPRPGRSAGPRTLRGRSHAPRPRYWQGMRPWEGHRPLPSDRTATPSPLAGIGLAGGTVRPEALAAGWGSFLGRRRGPRRSDSTPCNGRWSGRLCSTPGWGRFLGRGGPRNSDGAPCNRKRCGGWTAADAGAAPVFAAVRRSGKPRGRSDADRKP